MKKTFLLFVIAVALWLTIFSATAQTKTDTVQLKDGHNLLVVHESTTPPTPCQCEPGKDGRGILATVTNPLNGAITFTYTDLTTYTTPPLKGGKGDDGTPGTQIAPATITKEVPYGSPARVTSALIAPNTIQYTFEIPLPRQPDPCNCTGGGTSIQGVINVMTEGAKGDGVTDDTQAFQNAFNKLAGNGYRGKILIPLPSNFYKLTNTILVGPSPAGQAFIDIEAFGWGNGTNAIRYMGASNKPVFKIVGLKSALWTGLKVGINEGLTGVVVFDIDTTPSAGSTSFVTFKNFYINVGNQPNNEAFRLGHLSGGGADISNYQWENCYVSGNNQPGQIAYHIEGVNTLSQTWNGGFVSFMDKIYSNVSRSNNGASSGRGNGSVFFFGLGGSQNNVDFEIAWEQQYLISGGRFESSRQFVRVVDGGFSSVTIENCQIHDYKNANNIIEALVGCSLKLENVQVTWTGSDGKKFNPVININTARIGSLTVTGGGFSSDQLYSKSGALWNFNINGAAKVNIQYGYDFFNNEIGIRK